MAASVRQGIEGTLRVSQIEFSDLRSHFGHNLFDRDYSVFAVLRLESCVNLGRGRFVSAAMPQNLANLVPWHTSILKCLRHTMPK
jgi:hypothetical protein